MIRRAEPEEAPAIAALYERSFATLTYLPVLHTSAEIESFIARQLAAHEVWVWDDGSLAGFMVLTEDELSHLYLEPARWNEGIGTALLAHAKARRPGGFTLWTFQQNEGARRFYERHGLRAVQFGDGSGNEEGVPDVKYAWRAPAGRGSSAR